MRTKQGKIVTACLMLMCSTGAIAGVTTDQVEFNFNFTSGEFPGSEVQQWTTTHTDLLSYDETNGLVWTTATSHIDMTFAIGDQVVTSEADITYTFGGLYLFDMTFYVPEAPLDYGPMTIDINGDYDFNGNWEGTFTATLSPDLGFAGTELTGNWSAQVIPAPAGIALLGIAGLARRRRRN